MTNAKRIDGKAMAAACSESISARTAQLVERTGVKPGLTVVIVGEDPASQVYVRNKKRTAEACGFNSVQHSLPEDSTEEDVLSLIDELNNDPSVHGILVQLPLPGHLDEELITQSIRPEKDVDGFHFQNIGMLTAGHLDGAFVPCTPAGCMLMIEEQVGKDLSGLNAVIIGRSNIVGKPMASLLLKANATVTICHSRTKDLPEVACSADILVAAVGRAEMVKGEWIKPGAVVIDVGINRIEVDGEKKNKLVGDVNYGEAVEIAGAVTPVPGGVGPMTIVMLMANTLQSAERVACIS
ncbi:MAG: bifunctional methylenetetrahydrofolate dehydrogenase/methenyltetrahydrofolate cyclohydrolase FolD [Woeseiaceae bacterium]|nr:bifunctional methylenetetrahydrofolate dehydrogenase/methenyltetrahydrofolate cyclohydrolase FolD [Woeseiaceae bacterium]